jgi:hypothetical protein
MRHLADISLDSLTYGLLNDAVSGSYRLASNGRLICEEWIGQIVENSGGELIYATILNFLRLTEEND